VKSHLRFQGAVSIRQAAFLSVVLSVVFLPALASAQQVGDKIVVTAEKASLRANDAEIGTVPKGNILIVKNVNGDWFWVIWTGGHYGRPTVKGWINRSEVIAYSQALDFFNDELRRNPTPYAYSIRGLIWNEKGQYDLAIGDFNEAIRLDRKDAAAYHSRGFAWEQKGNLAL
jgi:tetratricopeptide (TPR) repeat protein